MARVLGLDAGPRRGTFLRGHDRFGLTAGPVFMAAVGELGGHTFLAGVVVTVISQLFGLLFGHYVLA
jgi:uncharacterized transporter YbjL